MATREAPAARALLTQATKAWPKRRRTSDGIVPSAAHTAANPSSDHEVGKAGYNHAVDLSDDPLSGCDCNLVTEAIRKARDPRVRYVIHDGRIFSSYALSSRAAWAWGTYSGSNKHTNHAHVSLQDTKVACANVAQWPGVPKMAGTVSPDALYGIEHINVGAVVEDIQKKLVALKYDLGPTGADGDFGAKTEAAVIAFQKKTWPGDAKQWDGIVGPLTMAALNAAYAKATAPPPVVVPPVTNDGFMDGQLVIVGDAALIRSLTGLAKTSSGCKLAFTLDKTGLLVPRKVTT